ncbi:hypothetical protein G6F31_018479 [Rhizopus arrhizus]|nr:hypothetical protein G6F31_018479 [Rhizopus arrhizus]
MASTLPALFPTRIRYSALASSFNIAIIIAGLTHVPHAYLRPRHRRLAAARDGVGQPADGAPGHAVRHRAAVLPGPGGVRPGAGAGPVPADLADRECRPGRRAQVLRRPLDGVYVRHGGGLAVQPVLVLGGGGAVRRDLQAAAPRPDFLEGRSSRTTSAAAPRSPRKAQTARRSPR